MPSLVIGPRSSACATGNAGATASLPPAARASTPGSPDWPQAASTAATSNDKHRRVFMPAAYLAAGSLRGDERDLPVPAPAAAQLTTTDESAERDAVAALSLGLVHLLVGGLEQGRGRDHLLRQIGRAHV